MKFRAVAALSVRLTSVSTAHRTPHTCEKAGRIAAKEKARAEAFSDGVLAVAITLLVLDLHVEATGHGSLSRQLAQTWPAFAAYLVSFFVIGVIWVNHHALFALIHRVDRVLLFENLTLLMFVTTLPFTTSTLATFVREGGANARWAVLLYGISNIGMAFGFTAMLSRIVAPRPAGEPRLRRGGQAGGSAVRARNDRPPHRDGNRPFLATAHPHRDRCPCRLLHDRADSHPPGCSATVSQPRRKLSDRSPSGPGQMLARCLHRSIK